MAFATADDYEARYGTAADPDRLEVLLDDAAAFLELELKRRGKQVDPDDELQANALVRISCRLAHDLMDANTQLSGVSQARATVGPFSNSWSFVNPTGAYKLLKSERLSLGIGGGSVGSVAPRVVSGDDREP